MRDRDHGTEASQSPKNEILNPKQTQMTKTKTVKFTYSARLPCEFSV